MYVKEILSSSLSTSLEDVYRCQAPLDSNPLKNSLTDGGCAQRSRGSFMRAADQAKSASVGIGLVRVNNGNKWMKWRTHLELHRMMKQTSFYLS